MGDWLQDKCNEIQKAQQEHIQKSFGSEDIYKSFGEGSRGGRVIGHTKSGHPIYETKFTVGDQLVVKDKNHKWYGKKVHVQTVNRATDKGALKQHSYLVGKSPKGNAEAISEDKLGFENK